MTRGEAAIKDCLGHKVELNVDAALTPPNEATALALNVELMDVLIDECEDAKKANPTQLNFVRDTLQKAQLDYTPQ